MWDDATLADTATSVVRRSSRVRAMEQLLAQTRPASPRSRRKTAVRPAKRRRNEILARPILPGVAEPIEPLALRRKRDRTSGTIARHGHLLLEAKHDLARINAALRLFEVTGGAADLPPHAAPSPRYILKHAVHRAATWHAYIGRPNMIEDVTKPCHARSGRSES